jgi:asparagine synthase (glutamine-hydrolysing)
MTVERMVQALKRRGPDSGGMHTWPRAVFGHRRLAIFDLSPAGHQPMLLEDGELGVVFNGAVYNFKPLREELERAGAVFRSRTDTEVLLWGYREWGIDGLVQRIRGMFAFALWDERRGALWLVRDRLGVKPLVYVKRAGTIAFASTVRALHAAGLVEELDANAVAEFLEYGFVSEEHVIYRGAQKVPAATIVEFVDGVVTERRYWSPPAAGTAPAMSFDDAVAETERLLLAATERRLHADVPVGALLSGGIDSALVCWAIRSLGGDVTAFTAGTPGHEADETNDAVATARELGIAHEILPLSDEDESDVSTLVQAYAEPFACSSALGMLTLSRAVARSSAKVLLTGDGGDDVFLGYERHLMLRRIQDAARFLPAMSTSIWRSVRGVLPDAGAARRAKHFVDYLTGGLGAFLSGSDGLPGYRAAGILGPRLRESRIPARELPWSVAAARTLLRDYLAHDLRTQFVAEYLTKVDGATMHHAIEARSPFLDQELWEFASALPVETRLRGGVLKAVLRTLAERRIGPRVAAGRKRGFTIPVESWIAGRWHAQVESTLRDSTLSREGWVSESGIRAELSRARSGGEATRRLWYLYVLESWLRGEHRSNSRVTRAA